MRWLALAIFIVAGVTDFFDGYLARAWSQQSSLGRMLDPIADKLLVAASLLMLVADKSDHRLVDLGRHRDPVPRDPGVGACGSSWPSCASRCRSARSPSGRRPCSSSRSASWSQGRPAKSLIPGTTTIGLGLLWIAAVLTLYTGWDYMKAGINHVVE